MSVLSRFQPDNSAVVLRQRARMNGLGKFRGGLPGALGDYPADLPNRILMTKGETQGGPLSFPAIEAPLPDTEKSYLRQITELLERMPQALSDEFRTRFVITPREAISFIAPGGTTTIAPGAAVAIVAQLVAEQFAGFVTHVGVNVVPAGAFATVIWQIRINGAIHPLFFDRIFAATTLSTPIPFPFELTQNRTVQLVAINTGAVAVDVAGVLVGWTEYLTTGKRYGSSPSTGIA